MTLTEDQVAEIERIREESATALSEEGIEQVERFVREIDPELLEAASATVASYLPDRGIHVGLHHVMALLAARRNEHGIAREVFERVVERLNQAADFAGLVRMLARNQALVVPDVSVPLLVRAWVETSGEALPLAAIDEWRERFPDDVRLDWLAGNARLAGGDPEAVPLLARALEYLARETAPETLEEAVLPVLERLDAETAPLVAGMLRVLLTAGRIDEVETYLELSLDALLEHGQAGELWEMLRTAVASRAEAAVLRDTAVAVLRVLHAGQPRFDAVVTASGLEDAGTPFSAALELYARINRMPPGCFVDHTSWGIGEVVENDGEVLLINFPARPMHQMQRRLAESALERRDADDLRVLTAWQRARLGELRDEDPATLVVAALKVLGGEGKPRDLRRLLTADVMSTEAWPAWWKRTRATLDDDLRIDLSQTFRDVYRLVQDGADGDGVPLPQLNDRDDPAAQIRMLRRFLGQHPDARQRVIERHSRRLERWLVKRRLIPAQRMLVRVVLADWYPERRADLAGELVQVCREGFDLSELTDVRDQEMLLEIGLAEEGWRSVAEAGLDSRAATIRARARAAIEERLSPAEAAEVYRELLDRSPARGDAVLEVADMVLAGVPALAGVSAVTLFVKLLAIVSEPQRDALRNRAMRLLAAEGPVFSRLRDMTPSASEIDQAAIGLLSFRASDQLLNPILDSLERSLGPEALAALRRRRQQESAKIAARMDDDSGFPTVLFMSRASHRALRAEIERVEHELRTSIPRAIKKAREHGDLRENAEYDAAKLKQQQYSDRLAQLLQRFEQTAVIEDAVTDGTVDGTEIHVGTEVELTLVESGESLSYWVLGYDDGMHGTNVISFQAEIGRALWRHRVGDELEIPGAEGNRRVRVERIRVKLPPPPAMEGSEDP